jgi:ketosteroid isomerase-like protein
MSDPQEIANLLYRYGYLIDGGDFAGIGALFGDAVLTADGTDLRVSGADAIQRYYESTTRRYEDSGTPKTKHVFTNLLIEVDDARDTAESQANYLVLQATDKLSLQPIITGRYKHSYEKRGGRWRFTLVKFFVDQVGDLSQHLLFDLAKVQTNEP